MSGVIQNINEAAYAKQVANLCSTILSKRMSFI